ncbi:uncharacterized protein N7459_005728 [Penicillium hispanicum]|uniref:uncharacterized protein n=1 Tax=Penicillium hispanicum TaxID=1080232 RepID=UPI002541B1C5|nr:uncharacterized protein N7459_005728 [Penicillium hispanicum]KAJ5579743.1 hypothetical protein N7459_005728 [Penicillium hispanicum]
MSRSQRQWLGYILAALAVILLYREGRSLTDYQIVPAQSQPIGNPDPPDTPSSNPQDEQPPPEAQPQPVFRWRTLPMRFPPPVMNSPPLDATDGLPQIQPDEAKFSAITTWFQKSRQAAVKEAFTRCWEAYKSLAWRTDELAPLSGLPRNGLGGWGATLIDNLDTLWIMDMRQEFEKAVATVARISFEDTPSPEINTHEINIRILGGLLGAYELSADERLLVKAREVGDMLYTAFDTPNRMPITHWDIHKAAQGEEQVAEEVASGSELGSFILEFTRLSQISGDPKYFNSAQHVMERFEQEQDVMKLTGMWPVALNARTESFDGDLYTFGAEVDSLYKTLPKAFALLGGRFPMYRKMYEKSTRASHSLFRPMNAGDKDILIPGNVRVMVTQNGKLQTQLESQVHHRACFAGGMFAFGGTLFNIPSHRKIAQKLVDGCIWASKSMPLGVMPEVYETIPCASQVNCPWDEWHWKQEVRKRTNSGPEPDPDINVDEFIAQHRLPKGFIAIPDTGYNLRPETIESMFMLYRITGREDLLDIAWQMFETVQKATWNINGNAALVDVTNADGEPAQSDSMESYWMAQTLKYFYLMFSSPDLISLDKYVFNSGGHPLQVPQEKWQE